MPDQRKMEDWSDQELIDFIKSLQAQNGKLDQMSSQIFHVRVIMPLNKARRILIARQQAQRQ